MEEKLDRLKALLGEIADIERSIAVLNWDMQTYMPAGGTEERGHQMSTLAGIAHQKETSEEMGQLLADLQTGPESDEAGLIRVAKRNYDKSVRVPSRLVAEMSTARTFAHEAWVRARTASDFSIFQPHLEKVVELTREYASLFAPFDHIYDPLLDNHEPGLKTAEVQAIFDQLRPQQTALIKVLATRPQVDDIFLRQPYPQRQQWDFGVDVITRLGFDWKRGRQDRTAHPFTTSFGMGDVRITTRFDPSYGASALFSTIHEAGHALYEQGYSPAYKRSPLAASASMSIHESQSRLYENLLGRSLSFWTFFFPRLQQTFPAQLGSVDLWTFYRGINRVAPSMIRTDADEATYNLHIMLRMEIESAMMEGRLQVSELPEVWDDRMEEYLGVRPRNQAEGVLQDVHWSYGSIGYFPTYALGNLISAQLWEKIHQAVPDLEEQVARGEFGALLGWLRENIHRHGAKYEPQELVERATGSKIDPGPYLRYLKEKYNQIYNLMDL